MTRPSFDERLRLDAAPMRRRAPAPELHGRILASLGDQDPPQGSSLRSTGLYSTWTKRRTPALAAAAALVLVVSALFAVTRSSAGTDAPIQARAGDVVELSRDILNPALLAQVSAIEDPLMVEARNLWADTSRAAESVARGLRTPWRLREGG